jgi:soluble lytic murein transglycosylase-like protein
VIGVADELDDLAAIRAHGAEREEDCATGGRRRRKRDDEHGYQDERPGHLPLSIHTLRRSPTGRRDTTVRLEQTVVTLRRRLTLCVLITAALGVTSAAAATPPAPNAPLPTTPASIAAALTETTASLNDAIDAWRADGAAAPAPDDLVLLALYQQRLTRLLSARQRLARTTLPLLSSRLRAFVRDVVVAHSDLVAITPALRTRMPRVGPPAPAPRLLSYYNEAERRFGVAWRVLAAVNFVESAFGKLRSASAAGAQGPMQFMPATWRTYGLGGDVHDPHDAILGAANYLRASGARHDIRRALHAYNPSAAYVDAVLRYARQVRADIDAFYSFYNWQVFARTRNGVKRLTGPGR